MGIIIMGQILSYEKGNNNIYFGYAFCFEIPYIKPCKRDL